jgi:hypothetical protein
MRVALVLLALAAIVAAFLLLERVETSPPPKAPVAEPAECVVQPPPPLPGAEPVVHAGPGPVASEARTVRVLTNVPGASVTLSVELYGGTQDPEPISALADAQGNATFTLPSIEEPIAQVVARASAPDHAPHRGVLNLNKGEVRLSLVPAFPVRGRVLARAGGPVAGATVTLRTQGVTDETGAFEVFARREGEVRAVVKHPEYREISTTVSLPCENLEFVLERGLTVSGRVTFPDGTPVDGADLEDDLEKRVVQSGPDGTYVLSGFEDRKVGVRCRLASWRRVVRAGARGVDFVVPRNIVRFHVKDEWGRPFRRAQLRFGILPKGTPFS